MTQFGRSSRREFLGGMAAAGLMAPTPLFAADQFKMSLEFRIYGGNAPMFLAQEKIYAKHGLDITPEGSAGSDESIRRVAAGNYPFGLADASTVVAFAGRNPGVSPKILMPLFDRFPACIISLKKKPVKSIEDLKKVKLGSASSDAGSRIFPVLVALNKIDVKSLDITTVDVKLRDALLLQGQVDAVIGFDYTSVFNLIGNGLKMEDINLFYFSEMGFGMFGNSLIAHPDVVAKQPDLCKRVAAATAEAWIYSHANPQQAIDAVVKRDKLLTPDVELQRLKFLYAQNIVTENVKKNGLGSFDTERMSKAIGMIAEAFQLTSAPAIDAIYDGRFMPPQKDRLFA
jgi:NitT/TauT family transport system substrate-binding protein